MLNRFSCRTAIVAIVIFVSICKGQDASSRSRHFSFTYAGRIDHSGVAPVKVWLPAARNLPEQQVSIVDRNPPSAKLLVEPRWGNQIIYFDQVPDTKGSISFSVRYEITRLEAGPGIGDPQPADTRPYLKPDAKVPVGGPTMSLLKDVSLSADPVVRARQLYEIVDDHMQYRKDRPGWGRGDAVWACQSGFGNCTDFHSLFISLARGNKLPARFQIGFLLPEKRGSGAVAGYHCWAFVLAGDQWRPVDISEANKNPSQRDYYFGHLTPDRVAFTDGRDLVLSPKQDGPPLNFFIYPYAESEGKPLPSDQIRTSFTYEDIQPNTPQ